MNARPPPPPFYHPLPEGNRQHRIGCWQCLRQLVSIPRLLERIFNQGNAQRHVRMFVGQKRRESHLALEIISFSCPTRCNSLKVINIFVRFRVAQANLLRNLISLWNMIIFAFNWAGHSWAQRWQLRSVKWRRVKQHIKVARYQPLVWYIRTYMEVSLEISLSQEGHKMFLHNLNSFDKVVSSRELF